MPLNPKAGEKSPPAAERDDAELCAAAMDALDHLVAARRKMSEIRSLPVKFEAVGGSRDYRVLSHDHHFHQKSASASIRRMLRAGAAATPAGLFYKALVLHHNEERSQALAASLARDLVNNPAFRRLLWPADPKQEGCAAAVNRSKADGTFRDGGD